ncbi:MAG: metal-sensing transcriptional repressor [Clostridia bacterium]|nr:metal-sensing transcriptional repressor [Clostridia bacterium]MBQ8973692.1 metal-sensing transcriptional repressor [Clostridia bacterium]
MDESCCCQRHKQRSEEEIRNLTTRLNRIGGQVAGIRKMIEEDRYCVDVLMQVSAVQAALNAFNKELLSSHIHSCVVDDIRAGKDEAVDELCDLLKKTMK